MSKRGPEGQGDKLKGLDGAACDPEDTPVKANAAQLAARRIASAKVRRGGGGGNRANLFSPHNSAALQALGNPFANPVNGGTDNQNSNMSTSGFGQQQGQQQSAFIFGSSQSFPPVNNNITFGSQTPQNASFPPPPSTPQTSSQPGNNLFGSVAPPSGGFAFTATPNNPFNQSSAPSQPSFSNSIFGSPAGNNNTFGGFGQPNASNMQQQQLQTSPGNDSMQISPPVTPLKGTGSTPARPSIFSTMTAGSQTRPTTNFFEQLQKQTPQLSSFQSLPSNTSAQAPANSFGTFSSPHKDPPKFNFGQMQSNPSESTAQSSTPGQNASVFSPFANMGQPFGSKATESQQKSSATSTSGLFGSAPSFAPFGNSATTSTPPRPTSSVPPSSNLFQFSAPAAAQSFVQPSTNLFKPSAPAIAPTTAESANKNIFGSPKALAESTPAPASNPFVNLKAPSTLPSSAAPSSSFDIKGAASSLSSSALSSVPSLSANSANPASSISVGTDLPSSNSLTEAQKEAYKSHLKLRSLNDGFRRTIRMLDIGFDWTDITRAYISQYEKIVDSSSHATAGAGGKRKAVEDLPVDGSKQSKPADNRSRGLSSQLPSNGTSQTANLFRNIADYKTLTQESSTQNSVPNVSSAPTFRAADPENGVVTPWVTSTTSSNLPSSNLTGGTSASNLFASKPHNSTALQANMFAPKTLGDDATVETNMFSSKASSTAAPSNSFGTFAAPKHNVTGIDSNVAPSNPFATTQPSDDSVSAYLAPSAGSLNPSEKLSSAALSSALAFSQFSIKPSSQGLPPASSSAPTFKVPAFGNVSSGPNFMAQFGKQAEKDAVKAAAEAKRKRKAEDFDSDEDDEDEWERKDAEEQRAKKARMDEEAKGNKLKFIPGKGFAIEEEEASSDTTQGTSKAGMNGGVFMQQHSGEEPKPIVSNNIFSHLAGPSTNSSQSGDAGNDDEPYARSGEEHEDQSQTFAKASTGQLGGTTDESSDEDESLEEAIRRTTKPKESLPAKQESNSTGRSLFDRITFPAKETNEKDAVVIETKGTNSTIDSPFKTNGIASNAEPSSLGTTSPAGDHTWKVDSPIKFGASSAPAFNFMPATPTKPDASPNSDSTAPASARPFAGLFGSITPSSTASLFSQVSTTPTSSPSKPVSSAFGFNFGGPPHTNGQTPSSSLFPPAASQDASTLTTAVTSRATTPGADSGTEGAEGDAERALDQKDLTNLTEQEHREEEILFEMDPSRFLQHNKEERRWDGQGNGPLRVLKNKETGVVRIVCRIRPSGRIVVNTRLLKGTEYKDMGKKMVRFMVADEDGKLATWMVKLGDVEDCTKLVEVLTNHRPG